MNQNLLSPSSPVLAVLAHPDDEAITCFGTLAMLSALGKPIHLLFLTDGGQGRTKKNQEVADLISASYKVLDYPVSNMTVNLSLIKAIEQDIKEVRPSLVITHSSTPLQHQDHIVVSSATVLAARRHDLVSAILQVEPPNKCDGFSPNLFIDIEPYFEVKIKAANLYRQVLDRWYMHPDSLRTRALWWGLQAKNSSEQALYEAFSLSFLAIR